jgi:drug/metabolite transporter (DMT)-like permease
MMPALFTLVCWSISAVAAGRTATLLGATRASRLRLVAAFALLALPVIALGALIPPGPTAWWLLASGAIGLGLGDFAYFLGCARAGARLVTLIEQCAAVPIAALLEWWWLGGSLGGVEILACSLCVLGVAVALAPGSTVARTRADLWVGCAGGLVAAVGMAVSGVVTRQAVLVSAGDGVDLGGPLAGLGAALWRILGGIAVVVAASALWPWLRFGVRHKTARFAATVAPDWRRGWPWLLAATLGGPVLGVACYQWALVGAKAGPVLALLALVPVAVMPLTWAVEGDRPHPLAWVGAAIAVAGAVLIGAG